MKAKIALVLVAAAALAACKQERADTIQAREQEKLILEATAQTGMPAITNFRERKTLKQIYELRDQESFMTYTYTVNKNGELKFLCNSVGFAISDATGYTNPVRIIPNTTGATMPQAEPNGLYTPDASTANWVMCLDKDRAKAAPVYIQTDIVVSAVKFGE